MKSRKYNHAWSLYKVPQRERTTYGIINKVIYYDKAKDKDITRPITAPLRKAMRRPPFNDVRAALAVRAEAAVAVFIPR